MRILRSGGWRRWRGAARFCLAGGLLLSLGSCVPWPPGPSPADGAPTAGDDTTAQSPPPGGERPQPPTGDRAADFRVACVDCHSLPWNPRGVVDAAQRRAHWTTAAAQTDAECEQCHDVRQHPRDAVYLWENPPQRTASFRLDLADRDRVAAFCRTCHAEASNHVHHGGLAGCLDCHATHQPGSNNLAHVTAAIFNQATRASRPVVFTSRTGTGSFSDGSDTNTGICQVCHTATRYHRYDGSGAAHHEGENCTTCHAHQRGYGIDESAGCIACHSVAQGRRPAVVRADGSGGHHLGGDKLADVDCLTCHDHAAHKSGLLRLWKSPTSRSEGAFTPGEGSSELTAFCRSCHAGASAPGVHAVRGSWQPDCGTCHRLHEPASANRSLVAQRISDRVRSIDREVLFTSRTGFGSFSDGQAPGSDVCQVCHTQTRYHNDAGPSRQHREGEDCARCHTHVLGFVPAGGTSCLGCHNRTQGSRRAVAEDFDLASQHAGGVTDADCLVCHDTAGHGDGAVRLRNVDDPNNAAAVVVLSGDPSTSYDVARQAEPFCLACHDADGAHGAVPFRDGRQPPAVDAVAWKAGAHQAGRATCLGDGESFGCHTSHGSVKQRLLAPRGGPKTGVPGDPLRQEEGQCYSCHDADGPARSDVQAQFSLAAHHDISDLDQGNGARLECTSCHDPHAASAAARLKDPDTGRPWSGNGEAFCLTCHDGQPPAGVSFPATSAGTGFDKSAFTGTPHSRDLGSNGCEHCHLTHGSADAALLRARYVTADNNPYDPKRGDYAACWQCHDENKVIRQANGFETNHKVHVDWAKTPCIVCHDVHRAFDAGEPGLIDFDYPVRRGTYDIRFIGGKDGSSAFWLNEARTRGNCYIRCHQMGHAPMPYVRGKVPTTSCSACH